ncbi:DUF4157 domain-containing protein [Mucilaginibacter sp. BJC16-A38]|uniref:eCIS core domain-containing protein n=1 Tax=Mucilaginibacter phenanthrenivorans TaxID=1234842 RepID=UPI00215855F5|nr:DUF4157 domain-containing protein [Mucilaginibacter phenanthrenivorans]MCR8557637.1 DUF4157 domain-containing protein [Mucilaginibacter phenanthrenivorans]
MSLYENIGHKDKCQSKPGAKPLFFQAKYSINTPGDVYEQEADAMADKVLQAGTGSAAESQTIHRKESGDGAGMGSDKLDSYVGGLGASGQSMPEGSRKFFEPKFGHDFSNVKLHTDSVAAKSAQSINALAYTSGNNIVFNTGQYAPESDSGKKLMAHELTHVVQQGATAKSSGSTKSLTNTVQRAPGWADGVGTNKSAENVDKDGKASTTTAGTVLRIPLEGLKTGNQDDSMTKDVTITDKVTKKQSVKTVPVDTTEKAKGKAIALVPDGLDPTKPVEVLLNLHGHNEGYREVKSNVRDISLDRIEQQIITSGHGQMIGILPEGTTKSDWGANFNSDAYIKEVMGRIATEKSWKKAPDIGRVIVSAHSGGGNVMEEMLKPGGTSQPPGQMQELALFEAINGPHELAAVKQWITDNIKKDVNNLTTGAAADHAAYLAKSMRFRGYYTPAGSYKAAYTDLDKHIKKQFTDIVDKATGLDPKDAQQIKDNYQVIVTAAGTGHDEIMGKDDHLADSFKALPPL